MLGRLSGGSSLFLSIKSTGWGSIGRRVSGRLGVLMEVFGDIESAWTASPAKLRAAGLSRKTVEKFVHARDEMDLDAELARLHGLGYQLLPLDDAGYPEHLAESHPRR